MEETSVLPQVVIHPGDLVRLVKVKPRPFDREGQMRLEGKIGQCGEIRLVSNIGSTTWFTVYFGGSIMLGPMNDGLVHLMADECEVVDLDQPLLKAGD